MNEATPPMPADRAWTSAAAGRHDRPACRLDLNDPGRRVPERALGWLSARLQEALAREQAAGEVRIRIVGDAEMAEAHVRFSGVSGTTDVLTFDLRDTAEQPLDADLLICFDEAVRQSAAQGAASAVERELLLYALHGVLHCLGEDDTSEDASARMHAREDAILSAIGVGPVFSAFEAEKSASGEARP